MSESQDDDKQFEPTQKKLDDARKKGEIAKSTDLITACSYAGFLICAAALGPQIFADLGQSLAAIIGQSDRAAVEVFNGGKQPFFGNVIAKTVMSVAPFLILPAGAALLCIMGQRAFIIAPSKLAPKASRVSPIQGAKNKFGKQGLFEFFKSFFKLSIYSVILGFYLAGEKRNIIAASQLPSGPMISQLFKMALTMLFIVLIVAFAIGAVDYLWQAAQHRQKLRMSKKELTDELKQSEGDPMLKQQRRQKGVDIATNRMLHDVPKADVIVVNPTHYAIALEWSRLPGDAPVCVAKGVDEIAAKIREIAAENAIPIHSDPPTARAIFASVDLGEQVLPEHYQPVAAAIRFAEEIRKKAKHFG